MSYPNSLCGGGGLDGGVSEQTTSLLSASANRQRKSVIFVEVRGDLRARKGGWEWGGGVPLPSFSRTSATAMYASLVSGLLNAL